MNDRAPVATVIISPRDRYSGLEQCLRTLYACTPQPIAVWVLDLGYPQRFIEPARAFLADKPDARIIDLGLCVPMDALRAVRDDIATPYTVLLDNDSRVAADWLAPLLRQVGGDVAVVSPLTLETAGVDDGPPLRNHLYTGEMRVVQVEDQEYLIEQKHFRRTPADEVPNECRDTGTFELHCVLFDTETLKTVELPSAVTREHLDIALQVRARGKRLVVEPASRVVFDNLGTRMQFDDMRFFWYRWSPRLNRHSAELFERRWGYRFYTEQASFNWVVRRKAFLLSRWLHLPIGASNFAARVANRLFCQDWDPLPNADAASRALGARELIEQRSHEVR